MRNLVALPTIQNVAPGAHCVLNCPVGMTYDLIQFKVTNVAAADLKNFKIKAGSRTVTEVASFEVLEALNTFYNRKTQSGFLTLWFFRPEMKEDVQALTSFGTADVPSLTIEFDLAGTVSNPAIEAFAVQRAPQISGLVTKVREYPVTYATAGKQQIDNLPRGARISAIHLGKGDVTDVEFEINNGNGPAKIIEASKTLLETLQKQHDRVPVTASYTHLDFNLLGDVAGPLPTVQLQDMRIKHTIGTSGALTAVVEYIDSIGGV